MLSHNDGEEYCSKGGKKKSQFMFYTESGSPNYSYNDSVCSTPVVACSSCLPYLSAIYVAFSSDPLLWQGVLLHYLCALSKDICTVFSLMHSCIYVVTIHTEVFKVKQITHCYKRHFSSKVWPPLSQPVHQLPLMGIFLSSRTISRVACYTVVPA